MKLYALYHGDKFIDLGTKEYLAKLLNVKPRTITCYMSKAYRERNKNNCYIVIKIEEGE